MRYTNRRLLAAISYPHRGIALRDAPNDGGPGDGGGGGNGGDDKDGSGDDGDGDDKKPTIDGDLDPERAARTIAAARASEKKAKEELKAEKNRVAAILKAAGLTPDGKEDPAEALQKAVAERDAAATTARQNAIELAVYKVAGKKDVGADADAVLDSRGFMNRLKDADPNAADFHDQVKAAIKAAVKDNPRLAAQGAPAGRMGSDITGSGGTGGRNRATSLDAAVARKLTGG